MCALAFAARGDGFALAERVWTCGVPDDAFWAEQELAPGLPRGIRSGCICRMGPSFRDPKFNCAYALRQKLQKAESRAQH